MNRALLDGVKERFESIDETMSAEIFNIFASDTENLEFTLRRGRAYIFNLMDNKQASLAVRKFGFEAVEKAAREDWIIYAEQDMEGVWQFSSKTAKDTIIQYAEQITIDMVCRPKEYPSWAWDLVREPLVNFL